MKRILLSDIMKRSFGISYLARSVGYEGRKKKLNFKEIAIDGRQDIFMHIKKTI